MKKRTKVLLSIVGGLILLLLIAVLLQTGTGGRYQNADGTYRHLTTKTSFGHIYNHPLWEGNGKNLYSPWSNEAIADLTGFMSVKALCRWCGWDAEAAIACMNDLIDTANSGELSVVNVYSDEQIAEHPAYAKAQAVFYRGEPNKPVAVVAAGGGYTQVCSMFEGFPYAKILHEKGYNVFVLKYRVGSDLVPSTDVQSAVNPTVSEAGKDMITLLQRIHDRKDVFGVTLDGYSLWGSSAGGGLITSFAFAAEGPSFEELALPRPAALILVYTHAEYINRFSFASDDPPVFTIVGEGDAYDGDYYMDSVTERMREAGMNLVYHKYANYPHGAGLGNGTDAEGWITEAIRFWEEQQ